MYPTPSPELPCMSVMQPLQASSSRVSKMSLPPGCRFGLILHELGRPGSPTQVSQSLLSYSFMGQPGVTVPRRPRPSDVLLRKRG